MIIYVIDNNIFSRSFRNLSMDVFDDIWQPWSTYINEGRIISVSEVYRELIIWRDKKSQIDSWIKKHKECFLKPSDEEGYILQTIYKSNKFREGVKEKNLRNGTPEADAFVVAKAKSVGGIVVTDEKDDKPNSEKIPNIAVSQGVPYMKLDDFYRLLRNIHAGRPEEKDVKVYLKPGEAISLEELL